LSFDTLERESASSLAPVVLVEQMARIDGQPSMPIVRSKPRLSSNCFLLSWQCVHSDCNLPNQNFVGSLWCGLM
jgi:hypothetical protein